MIEAKFQKKYDFFDYNSELIIPKENKEAPSSNQNSKENSNLIQQDSKNIYDDNNLFIKNSTFVIKIPEKKKILLILSIDKDLPSKIEKNIFSIPFDLPALDTNFFMNDSTNESILVTTGNYNSPNTIQVFQIHIKQLMHEAAYNLLNDIKNAIKIMPIKDSFILVLHCFSEKYKNGELKLWKNFKKEIYNFNKVCNFTYNYHKNKIICIDNAEAPFTFSIYNFDESYFNKKQNELLQPDFFIQLGEHLHDKKEEDIESFLYFDSFCNLIIFWAKMKNEKSEFLFGIFFVDFKENKCVDYVDFKFDDKNRYFFKINKNTNEIYIFNLSEELLFIYSFKSQNPSEKETFSTDNLFLSKIKFNGNFKGIDFTANNGMVILTEEYNLVCYSRNEYDFQNSQKKYSEQISHNDSYIESNSSEKEEKLRTFQNNMNNLMPDIINHDLDLRKYNSEKCVKYNNNSNEQNSNRNKNNLNKISQKNKDVKNINKEKKEKIKLKIKEEMEKRQELLNKQNQLLDKLKLSLKEKNIIIKLVESYENKISKFEKNILSDISQLKLEEILNKIQSINIRRNIKEFNNFDFIFVHTKNFIYEILSIIPDLKYNKNKIISFFKEEIKRKNLIKEKNENNYNYESLDLKNKAINMQLKEKPKQTKELEKILYDCFSSDKKINVLSKINSIISLFENQMNILLLKCKNDINQISEMYKYNKYIMSKNEEAQLINYLIKPFIVFMENKIEELKGKMNILAQPLKEKCYDNNRNKELLKDLNKNKENYGPQLSNNMKEIFEKHNFYSLNENIIKNHYINLDKEFE